MQLKSTLFILAYLLYYEAALTCYFMIVAIRII